MGETDAKQVFLAGIDRLAEREQKQQIQVTVSDFIATHGRHALLFNQFYHPVKVILQHVCNQIFNHLDITPPFAYNWHDSGPMSSICCPPVRRIFIHNNCSFDCDFNTYKSMGESITAPALVQQFYEIYASTDKSYLKTQLKRTAHVISLMHKGKRWPSIRI